MRRALAIVLVAALAAVPTVALAAAGGKPDIPNVPGAHPALDKVYMARAKAKAARVRVRKRAAGAAAVGVSPALQAIAACESGGDPHAIGGGGLYRGKYQMTYSTWASVGGRGDPAEAPGAEQDRRAAILYAAAGPGQWPVCSR